MDLVNIVYRSLIYFGILALVVIIGSYISYRIRRKVTGQKFAYEEEIEKKKKEEEKKLAEQKAKREKEQQLKKAIEKRAKRPVIHTKAQKNVEIKKRFKEEPIEQRREKIKKRSITKTFTRKKRLEVVNPASYAPRAEISESKAPAALPSKTTAEIPRTRKTKDTLPPKKKKLHSLDENVLEKYAENEDEGLFTIKVKKSDDK